MNMNFKFFRDLPKEDLEEIARPTLVEWVGATVARVRATVKEDWEVFLNVLTELGLSHSEHFSGLPGVSWRYAQEYRDAYSVDDFLSMARMEAARRRFTKGLKERARSLGLAYWPALIQRHGVDPMAFVKAERVMEKSKGLWNNGANKGGWDSWGYYGIAPREVAEAWKKAGCKPTTKFRDMVRLRQRPNLGETFIRGVAKGDSVMNVRHYAKGLEWVTRHGLQSGLRKNAIVALGRISPWARWAALSGRPNTGWIQMKDLNWAEVDRLQKGPKWKRYTHMPERGKWWNLQGVDQPVGFPDGFLGKVPMGLYKRVMNDLGLFPFGGYDREGMRGPVVKLCTLFGGMDAINKHIDSLYIRTGEGICWPSSTLFHDAGQFFLDLRINIPGWRRLVQLHPEAIMYSGQWLAVEQSLGRVPKSLSELRTEALKVKYTDVENREVAELAAQYRLGQEDFLDYQKFLKDLPTKWLETIPMVQVIGEAVGLEGDWRLRRLLADDPLGPMLGVATNCCQHLHGAASSCAKDGMKSASSSFWVVEYKGSVVAQSWVWRADDVMVLDSIEALNSAYVEGIAHLYKEAARRTIGKLGITEVRIGDTAYGITREIMRLLPNEPVSTVGYHTLKHWDDNRPWTKYTDAKHQRRLLL